MKNLNLGILLVPLAAILAVFLPFSGGISLPASKPAPTTTQKTSQPDKAKGLPRPAPARETENNALSLIYDFLGTKPGECSHPWPQDDPRGRYTIEFLVATVPDPIDSRFDYNFDRYLDAIQKGVEAAGYVADRFDLPWLDPKEDGAGEEGRTRKPRFEREPGVMLFSGQGQKLLLLLLVGETPTTGINKTVFEKALGTVAQLSGWQEKKYATAAKLPACFPKPASKLPKGGSEREVKVLGPSFSGSATSIEFALRNWLSSFAEPSLRPKVRMISGSVTAILSENDDGRLSDVPGTSFSTTVFPTRIVKETFLKYLTAELGVKPGDIATLSEANTAYGAATRKQFHAKSPAPDGPAASQAQQNDESEILELRFPLHIATLRSASEKAQPAQSNTNTDLLATEHQHVRLSLESGSEGRDVAPMLSQVEPPAQEIVLSNVLSAIDNQHIRFVGLFASDILDRIFLAKEIRRHSPNTVLYTYSGDLLYLDMASNPAFQGMLVISPYPLSSKNQLWTSAPGSRRSQFQFPSHAAQGVYNATLALLDEKELMLEYRPPFTSTNSKPAMWLSAVGRDGIWPVKLLDYEDPKNYLFAAGEQTNPARYETPGLKTGLQSETALVAMILLSLLCAIGSSIIIWNFPLLTAGTNGKSKQKRKSKNGERPDRRASAFAGVFKVFRDSVFREHAFERRLHLFAWTVGAFTLYVLAVYVFALPRLSGASVSLAAAGGLSTHLPEAAVLLVMTLALLASVSAGTYVVRAYRQAPNTGARIVGGKLAHRTTLLAVFILPPLASYLVIRIGHWLYSLPTAEKLFFYMRTVDIVSGLSPLVPLYFVGAAGLLWAMCALRRLDLVDGMRFGGSNARQNGTSFLGVDTVSFAGLRQLEGRVTKLIGCSAFELPLWYVIVLPVGFACWRLLWVRFVPSIEGRHFDLFFSLAFSVVYLGLALAFLRFVCIWRELRRFLRRLAWHPMWPAFKDYYEHFPGMPRIDLMSPPPTLASVGFSVGLATQACRLDKKFHAKDHAAASSATMSEMEPLAKEAEAKLAEASRAEATGRWKETLNLRCETQGKLAEVSNVIARKLEPQWNLSGDASAVGADLDSTEDGKQFAQVAQQYLATRVVAFLHHVSSHLQNLALFVTIGLLLMLIAITSYPFQPRNLLLLFNWSIVLTVVGTTVLIFVQMNRDKILSLLTSSTPGQLNLDRGFVFKVLVYGLLPVLALFGAQFPEAVNWILSLVGVVQGGHH